MDMGRLLKREISFRGGISTHISNQKCILIPNNISMGLLTNILIGLIAALHLYFLYFEMFAWETIGKKTFKSLPAELFPKTKGLAANQGLYNGFLVAGLVWSLLIDDPKWSFYVAIFFLGCVLVAGVFGALTASKKIFWVQGLPALITLVLLHLK